MKLPIDIFGWIGMLLVVLAYYLVSNDKVKPLSNTLQGINLVGSIFIGINALYYGAMPSVGLNVVWFFIGIFALIKINGRKKTSNT